MLYQFEKDNLLQAIYTKAVKCGSTYASMLKYGRCKNPKELFAHTVYADMVNNFNIFKEGIKKIYKFDEGYIQIVTGNKPIKNGLLYNFYALVGSFLPTPLYLTSSNDWTVPTRIEWEDLFTYLGGQNVAGGILKEVGFDYWNTDNTGTDNYNFTARGSGRRRLGVFEDIKKYGLYWTSTTFMSFPQAYSCQLLSNDPSLLLSLGNMSLGQSVRIFRDATVQEQLELDGTEMPPYIGNDGREYKTVKINDKVWLAENLSETEYRNGTSIDEITDGTLWENATTGAYCHYDNDENNSYNYPFISYTIDEVIFQIYNNPEIGELIVIEGVLYIVLYNTSLITIAGDVTEEGCPTCLLDSINCLTTEEMYKIYDSYYCEDDTIILPEIP